MLYNLAVLGRGSAAAYYLNTLDQNEYPKILVIGLDDPWDAKRGNNPYDWRDPVNYINQTAQMIEHFGESVPAYSESGGMVPRRDWASANKQIIDQCAVKQVNGQVVNVKKVQRPEMYRVTFSKPEFSYLIEIRMSGQNFNNRYHAAKVVVATGAGAHKAPNKELENLAKTHPDRFMDMDAFARIPGGRRAGRRVIVQGPNAAVDTADTAQYNDCTVFWLVGSTQPAILATPHQVGARAILDGSSKTGSRKVQIDTKTEPERVEFVGGEVRVKLKAETLTADFYVWGIGQDEKGALSFIDSALLKELEPIYDVNQRHGEAWESVEGFQTKGTSRQGGFEVIGALARQVVMDNKGLNHTYLSQLEEVIQDLQKKILKYSGDVPPKTLETLSKKVTDTVAQYPDVKSLKGALEGLRHSLNLQSPTWQKQTNALVAMITNYAVAKLYFDKHGAAVKDEDLNNALKILTPSTVGSPQLGSIRTTTAAINGFMPEYVAKDANFSHDDQTMLRVYIAATYPLVSEEEAQGLIREIIGRRKLSRDVASGKAVPGGLGDPKPMQPYGFTPDEVDQFKMKLKVFNERRTGELSSAKVVGTGQTK